MGSSPSAIRPCDGRKGSMDTHGEQYESENLESACVAETRQALQPACFQLFALGLNSADGGLASAVVDGPVALRPNGLSTIVVADNFSQFTVCLRPDGSESIALAAKLGSLPKFVAARSSVDGDQSPSECVGRQGKNTAASGLMVDKCDSMLNPDALEFRPKSLSLTQDDTRERVGPEGIAKGRCESTGQPPGRP